MSYNAKIVIATHKEYSMPNDILYVPVLAGAADKNKDYFAKLGYLFDDVGINISNKNNMYSELTVAYWAAYNLDAEYIGLSHYRRYFKGNGAYNTLTSKELFSLLDKAEVVLPKKRHYGPVNVESHYGTTFDSEHLNFCRKAIKQMCPEYLYEFEKCMNKHSLHICNMFIMPKKVLQNYLKWLFDILYEVEKLVNFSNMNDFEKRVMGRLSERLLDVWINHNRIKYVECATIDIEGSNILRKISGFAKAKFLGKSYKESY